MPNISKNIEALENAISPEFIAYLRSDVHTKAQLVGGPGSWNVVMDGTALYPKSADHYVEVQLDAFMKSPTRRISFAASNFLFDEDQTGTEQDPSAFTPKPLNAESLCAILPEDGERIAGDFAKAMLRFVDGAVLDWFPSEDAGHLVIFGLGLGVHIEALVSALNIRTLIVVDHNPEFLKLSLHVVDWRSVRETLEARGGGLHIEIAGNGATLSNFIEDCLRATDFPRIDGTYIFKHYDLGPMLDAVTRLQQAHATIEFSINFFEDELLMVKNAAGNLAHVTHHRFSDLVTLRTSGGGSAIILGSGPSIDNDIEKIKELRSKGASVFAAGTAARVALACGLIPDFICEIENTSDIAETVGLTAQQFDLSECTLLASVTVDPKVSRFFNRVVFFHRGALSSTYIFADPEQVVLGTGPSVTNLASRAAISLGFHELILFGVDLGSTDKEKHHSQNTVYYSTDDKHMRMGLGMEPLTIPVRGNFREVVYTSSAFLNARTFFERLFRSSQKLQPAPQILNASDGAFIEGALPVDPSSVHLTYPRREPLDFSALLGKTRLMGGEKHVSSKLEEYKIDCISNIERLIVAISDLSSSDSISVDRFVDVLSSLKKPIELGDVGAVALHGSVLSMAQIAYVIGRRLPNSQREQFVRKGCVEAIKQLKKAKEVVLKLHI